jgi:hypothetical protein
MDLFQGFDDMEADLFGSRKTTPAKKNSTQPLGRTASPPRKSTPPKGALRPSTAPESMVKKTVTFSPPQTPPRTADSDESKSKPRAIAVREEVRAKVEKKKIDFGGNHFSFEMRDSKPYHKLLKINVK